MKFLVREGFVCHLINRIEIGDGKFQDQEINYYGGQLCDLTAEQAADHAHKLEPKDNKAAEFLEAMHPVASDPQALNITPESLALVKAMATEMAKAMVAAMAAAPAVSAPKLA